MYDSIGINIAEFDRGK